VQNTVIDWLGVRRILVVRLRSIGDTVLATPSLTALKRFLPNAKVDVLLEGWVAPLLDGFDDVDDVLATDASAVARLATARELRRRKYDVVFNLHGGTTATFLTVASGARYRVGYKTYQYAFLHNLLIGSPADFWKRDRVHSVEQQLALLGSVGVPVSSDAATKLVATPAAIESIDGRLGAAAGKRGGFGRFALLHPAAAFATKQWPAQYFARTADFLSAKGIAAIAIAGRNERQVLAELSELSPAPVLTLDDLSLPEITALASRAELFVGNDSGIAHIAAAVGTPGVVIFGSSNRDHWGPWGGSASEMVFNELPCQPCPGHECKQFSEPRCILNVVPEQVFEAIERVLS
jgi:lipopolysaccharide heptosyltransferase II